MGNRTPLTIIGTILMLVALGLGVFYFAIEYPRQAGLNGHEGRTTSGSVLGLGTEKSGRYTGFYADIEFADERGSRHQFRAFYTESEWGQMHGGEAVQVRYLLNDPSYAVDPQSYKGKRDPRIAGLLTGGLFLFGFVLFMLPRVVRT